MTEHNIAIPRILDADYKNLSELYEQLNKILPSLTEEDEVIFNFENIRWLNAEMTVFLGMLFSAVTDRNATVFAIVERLSLKTKEILLKNGFFYFKLFNSLFY